jgi:hypothetical protein
MLVQAKKPVPVEVYPDDLILCRYDLIEENIATGTLFFKNFEIKFESGGWGKGYAPKGNYIAKNYRDELGDAYSRFGIGFFVSIIPQFETDRIDLGIHFDGNVRGTLGCIGLKASTQEKAIMVKNLFRNAFDVNKEIPFRII